MPSIFQIWQEPVIENRRLLLSLSCVIISDQPERSRTSFREDNRA
jgi:hypothetical protein